MRRPLDHRASDLSRATIVAIGSNLGDRARQMRQAVSAIAESQCVRVLRVSRLYETAPVGGPDDQGAYLNAALLGESLFDARQILDTLHDIEAAHDRERTIRWGPRTLDLDLLICGDEVVSSAKLEVPHPRMHLRRFVMVPVCDVAPDLVHPTLGRTMIELMNELPVEPGDLNCVADNWAANKTESDTP